MKLALDAMGGDFAPTNPVAGAILALREYDDFSIIFVGDEQKVRAEVAGHGVSGLEDRIGYHHASQVVDMKDSGLDSVRRKKDSSVSRAVDLVKAGEADAVISAGHTGALVAARCDGGGGVHRCICAGARSAAVAVPSRRVSGTHGPDAAVCVRAIAGGRGSAAGAADHG